MGILRGVFFDAFKTLIDLQPSYPGAFAGVCRHFGYPVGEADVARVLPAIERQMEEMLRRQTDFRCSPGELGRRWVALNKAVFQAVGVEGDARALSVEMERRFDTGAYTRPFQDALPTLEALRREGFRLGVVSNGTTGVARCLELAGVSERVDFVLVSALVGWEKPAPEIFALGLKEVGLQPDEVVFVGDHYWVDIQGARAVGMEVVMIDREGRSDQADCPVVSDLVEFRRWLDGKQAPPAESNAR